MHTFTRGHFRIHYNSDLSGEAIISCVLGGELEIPCSVLLDFVAEHVRRERIAELEQMETNELLGIAPKA